MEQMTKIIFWNGNKSPIRQRHELTVLEAVLDATGGAAALEVDPKDYPSAEDEGNIFNTGADLLVTVAGNEKFHGKEKIVLSQPIAGGILGQRILIVREDRLAAFASLDGAAGLKRLAIGIPSTWADANLFRANGYPVVERGSFDDLFIRLKAGECDYVALGANEVEEAYADRTEPLGGLVIEPSWMIRYPMPLVFYVSPDRPELAQRMQAGLERIMADGQMDTIFSAHYGAIRERLQLDQRRVIELFNPMLDAD
jgi:ABC-type amino acid transport substrate-binding protein